MIEHYTNIFTSLSLLLLSLSALLAVIVLILFFTFSFIDLIRNRNDSYEYRPRLEPPKPPSLPETNTKAPMPKVKAPRVDYGLQPTTTINTAGRPPKRPTKRRKCTGRGYQPNKPSGTNKNPPIKP